MSNDKKRSLINLFSSIEYFKSCRDSFEKSFSGLITMIDYFYSHEPTQNWRDWHVSERPDGWEDRAVKNFDKIKDLLNEAVKEAERGDDSLILSSLSNIISLNKDMDVLGERWMQFVPEKLVKEFWVNLSEARQKGKNIWWTLRNSWKGDEVLNTEITGEIDKEMLAKYF